MDLKYFIMTGPSASIVFGSFKNMIIKKIMITQFTNVDLINVYNKIIDLKNY